MASRNKDHENLSSKIAEQLHISKRVVDIIVRHSFEFTAKVIRDTNDLRPIRARYLGIFAMRTGLKKK
jgi:hypothetical protein